MYVCKGPVNRISIDDIFPPHAHTVRPPVSCSNTSSIVRQTSPCLRDHPYVCAFKDTRGEQTPVTLLSFDDRLTVITRGDSNMAHVLKYTGVLFLAAVDTNCKYYASKPRKKGAWG